MQSIISSQTTSQCSMDYNLSTSYLYKTSYFLALNCCPLLLDIFECPLCYISAVAPFQWCMKHVSLKGLILILLKKYHQSS